MIQFSAQMRIRIFEGAFLFLALAVPFVAYSILALRYFYTLGALYGDAGVLAHVMWRSDLALHAPYVAGGKSFLATHTTFIFILTSTVSDFLPFSKIQFFSLVFGVGYAMQAGAVYWLLISAYLPKSMRGFSLAAFLGMFFAFNGIALAAARNPHFEMLIIGSGMLFLVALIRKKYALAALFFLLCLLTREDAGFDLFLLLVTGLVIGLFRKEKLAVHRAAITFAVCALIYSVLVLVVQHLFFPGGDAFSRVYFALPPVFDVSWSDFTNRIAFLATYRLYILLPVYIALVLAIRWRDPQVIAGGIAAIPWFFLNLFANSPYAATLSNYYAFPFIFALFWPLIGWQLECPLGGDESKLKQRLLGWSLMVVLSFVDVNVQQNPQGIDFPKSFVLMPSIAQQRSTDMALAELAKLAPRLGYVVADGSVIALDPDHYKESQLVWARQDQMPDTIIYFPRGEGTRYAKDLATRAGLKNYYKILDTSLIVATNRSLKSSHLAVQLCESCRLDP